MGRIYLKGVNVYKNHITCSVVRLILKHMNPKTDLDLVERLVEYIMEEADEAYEMGIAQGVTKRAS